MNKKILFLLGSMGRGGAEKVISIIANDYANKGWDVFIGLLLFNEVYYDLSKKIKIVDLTCGHGPRILKTHKWILGIRKLIKEVNPDVTLSFAARINVLTLLAGLGLNKRIIVSERNDPRHDGRGIIVNLAIQVLYPKSSKIIFQNKEIKELFGMNIQNKSIVIPNPVKIDRYRCNNPKNKIINVGRLTSQKNQEMLIRAFSKIASKYTDYDLWIYGDGELRQYLEKLCKDLRISSRVHMPGNIPKLHDAICDGKIFVLSSDYEGLSNAFLEAMMMGFPVITTRCAGSEDYVLNGYNGLVIPTGDEKALVNSLESFIINDEFRERCGANARVDTKRIGFELVLEDWRRVLEFN